jgi:hypothetical protein
MTDMGRRDRIEAVPTKGVAPTDPPHCKPRPARSAVGDNRFSRVL